MTREEYEAKIDEKLKAVKQELMSEFKEEEPSFDGWKEGDIYYFVDNAGLIVKDIFYMGDNTASMYRVAHGNAFRTYEEAEFKRERDAVLYELNRFAEPKGRIWDNNLLHYFIGWTYVGENEICVGASVMVKRNDIYFASKNDAEKAIKTVGEERIKKYYLQMED